MKPHFLFPYWCRYLGWGFVLLHVPISFIGRAQGLTNPADSPYNNGLFSGEHLFFIGTTLLMALGLFLVAFAKEKMEDEQIWQVRLNSLRWAIYLNYFILIACLIFINDTGHVLLLNLWIPLIFFITRFRWMIYRINHSLTVEG